jgi:hypothetical protein
MPHSPRIFASLGVRDLLILLESSLMRPPLVNELLMRLRIFSFPPAAKPDRPVAPMIFDLTGNRL